ncbi:hypothetical protein [Aristophania vespae]|uniref:hypothetical protein n=1 Tax=Aristophania vespae TaxID=2697033 RepID=UPI002351A935|nr:hypothetical protein [Aristophania vespae]UMM63129.1 hypothetical protein DM15PD_00830 [Aristophania vespae]
MKKLDPNTLPLALAGQALNRVIGTQVDSNGVASLAQFPLKVLDPYGSVIAKLTIATTPTQPGEAQPATLTVYTDDGHPYTVNFTIPPGAQGCSIADIEQTQDDAAPGQVSTLRLTPILDNGRKLSPLEIKLPPGKDSLTITNMSVAQEPVEAGKPSKVTVTATHNDGSQTGYTYEAPPGAPGQCDTSRFICGSGPKVTDKAITSLYLGGDDGTKPTIKDQNNQDITLALNRDLNAEILRAQTAEAQLLSKSGGTMTGPLFADGHFSTVPNELLSQPVGGAIGPLQGYIQAFNRTKEGRSGLRLVIKDGNGQWLKVFEGDNLGNLRNLDGKQLAIIDDVNQLRDEISKLHLKTSQFANNITKPLKIQAFRFDPPNIDALNHSVDVIFPEAFNASDPAREIYVTRGDFQPSCNGTGPWPSGMKETTNTGFKIFRNANPESEKGIYFNFIAIGPA